MIYTVGVGFGFLVTGPARLALAPFGFDLIGSDMVMIIVSTKGTGDASLVDLTCHCDPESACSITRF
jgi:hypothetical protein